MIFVIRQVVVTGHPLPSVLSEATGRSRYLPEIIFTVQILVF